MHRYHIENFLSVKFILLFFFFLVIFLSNGQTISVTNFYHDEKDLTANKSNTLLLDQNGDKCALIRVQTTQKGFSFDVGSMGIQKIDDSRDGEIWVYVPFAVRHISIRHAQLGSLPNYYFPIEIEKAQTYIMVITSDKVFVNTYDDTHKQKLSIIIKPTNSSFLLNGLKVDLNSRGEAEQELSFGTYTYKAEAEGFYPKEGQITINDSTQKQVLEINDLLPIKGKLSVHTNPYSADVFIDGVKHSSSSLLEPYELQIGKHTVQVSSDGYKTESQSIMIEKDKTLEIQFSLSQVAKFKFTSSLPGAEIIINKENIGVTPCEKELSSGTYLIKATKSGCKDFSKSMVLKSSDPKVHILLRKILNEKNEFYIEGSCRAGLFMAFGSTLGTYFSNFNIEASYLYGTDKSETIYWSGNIFKPISSFYVPQMTLSGKIGYGFPLGTRFRLTPQIGVNVLKLKETIEDVSSDTPADGAYVVSGLTSLRFSTAITRSFALSLSPEYSFGMMESKGFKALSDVSPKIKKWKEGFTIKIGVTLFF